MFEILYLGSIFCALVTVYLLMFKEDAIRSYADYLLSIFLILVVWNIVLYLLVLSGKIINYPYLYKTGAANNFLIIPISFLYVRAIMYNEKFFKLFNLWHFLPLLLVFLNYTPYYFSSIEVKRKVVESLAKNMDQSYQYNAGFISENIVYFFRVLQNSIYLILQWNLVITFKKKYKEIEVQKQVKDVLKWVKIFNWACTASLMALITISFLVLTYKSIFVFFSFFNYLPSLLYSVSFLIMSTYLLTHPNILAGLPFIKYKSIDSDLQNNKIYSLPYVNLDSSKEIQIITSYFENEKPFLINNLNINQVSVKLSIPARELSFIINNHFGYRFTDFLNKYRIEYITKKINKGYLASYTMEAIAREAGFTSKSTFNLAFKKFNQCTPTEYLSKNEAN
jgi:AraC-like DNA-binding protein